MIAASVTYDTFRERALREMLKGSPLFSQTEKCSLDTTLLNSVQSYNSRIARSIITRPPDPGLLPPELKFVTASGGGNIGSGLGGLKLDKQWHIAEIIAAIFLVTVAIALLCFGAYYGQFSMIQATPCISKTLLGIGIATIALCTIGYAISKGQWGRGGKTK